jgi:hypothetical protein
MRVKARLDRCDDRIDNEQARADALYELLDLNDVRRELDWLDPVAVLLDDDMHA